MTLYETRDSREANVSAQGGGETLRYIAIGSFEETEVYIAAVLVSPGFLNGFVRNDIRMSPLGGPNFKVEVTYGPTGAGGGDQPVGSSGLGGSPGTAPSTPASDAPLGAGYSFSTGGGTTHITQSLGTPNSVKVGGGAGPDYKRAIGKTKDRIEGVDVFTPKFDWSRTVQRPEVTLAYKKTLSDMTGVVNNDVFYGFAAGEVLYLGASGTFTQNEGWSITHNFSRQKNQLYVTINDDLELGPQPGNFGFAKLGWQYLWVAYSDEIVGDEVAPRAIAAFVEDVYEMGDFTRLGIS